MQELVDELELFDNDRCQRLDNIAFVKTDVHFIVITVVLNVYIPGGVVLMHG